MDQKEETFAINRNTFLKFAQIVVVTCNEKREQIIRKQLEDINTSIDYYIYKGFTPAQSKEYMDYRTHLSGTCDEFDETLCCMRSHAGAIDHAVKTFPDKIFYIMMEDDVALINEFDDKVNDVIELSAKHMNEIDSVYLSYLSSPESNNEKSFESKFNNIEKNLFWNKKDTVNIWGTQMYMLKRSVALEMAEVLHKNSASELNIACRKKYDQVIEKNKVPYSHKEIRIQSDVLLSLLWRQAVVFPVLGIEFDTLPSIITKKQNTHWDHCNKDHYYKNTQRTDE